MPVDYEQSIESNSPSPMQSINYVLVFALVRLYGLSSQLSLLMILCTLCLFFFTHYDMTSSLR